MVTTNDPNHPTEHLTCKGQILEGYKIEPKNVNFGSVSRKSPAEPRRLTVTRADAGPLDLKLKPVESKDFKAELHEISPGERYELVVSLVPPLTSDQPRTKITLETGIEKAPTIDVSAYAMVAPLVRTTPRRVVVPERRKPGWEQAVTLQWDDDVPHRIVGAISDDDALTVDVRDADGGQEVVVRAPLDKEPKVRTPVITIKTDYPEEPEVRIHATFSQTPRYRPGRGDGEMGSDESKVGRGRMDTRPSKVRPVEPTKP